MIRQATKKDSSRLAEIMVFSKRTAYRKIFNNDKVSFGEMQVLPLAMEFISSPHLLEKIFVYDDQFVRGMINISIDSGVMEVKELYVDTFFQNQRIGSELLSYIEGDAKKLEVLDIFLWVLEKNIAARRFYEKHGYTPTNDKKLEEGTTEYIVKYQKRIEGL